MSTLTCWYMVLIYSIKWIFMCLQLSESWWYSLCSYWNFIEGVIIYNLVISNILIKIIKIILWWFREFVESHCTQLIPCNITFIWSVFLYLYKFFVCIEKCTIYYLSLWFNRFSYLQDSEKCIFIKVK